MVKVIVLDGPASSGKGTVAKILAQRLGYHYLESGAIYRAFGLFVWQTYADSDVSGEEIISLVDKMNLEFHSDKVWLNKADVTEDLRNEKIGMLASKYGAIKEVRAKLLEFQRGFAVEPGLVTDGRDMGSVVFPEAYRKFFLTASAKARAERRYKQLQQNGSCVIMESILEDIVKRDEQDAKRSVAPLTYDDSYTVIDNSELDIEQTINVLLKNI